MPKEAVFIQDGEVIDFVANSDVAVGDVIPLTNCVGVALEDIAAGETGAVKLTGVFEMPAETAVAFAVGDKLYWDETNGYLTKTDAGMVPAGICVEPKDAAGTVARVKIG